MEPINGGDHMNFISVESPGNVRVLKRPKIMRKENEVLLRMRYGGICGSDLGTYLGTFAYSKYPCIPGHELAAEIVECPENEKSLASGMLVTVNPYFNCGTCYSCRRGLVNCCSDNQTMGVQREGGFVEYLTMPVSRVIPGGALSADKLVLIEPFAIGWHGIGKASIQPGDRVLVIGAGTIGIFAAMSARLKGGTVTLCDISSEKLERAKLFGFRDFIHNTDKDSFTRQIGSDGFDVTVEAVGLPSTFQDCLDAAAYGGRVIVIGVGKKNLDFNFTLIQKKELQIFGSRNAVTADFTQLIELCNQGKIDLDGIVTDVFPYEQADDAFKAFSEHRDSKLKVLLKFGE